MTAQKMQGMEAISSYERRGLELARHPLDMVNEVASMLGRRGIRKNALWGQTG